MVKPVSGLVVILGALVTGSAAAESLRFTVLDAQTGAGLADAVVEVLDVPGAPLTIASATVDQVDKEFVPPVTVIPVGSRVRFPNSDDILHHVYSFSPTKTFDIPLYGRSADNNFSQVFDQAGLVEIGCNIHDWMLAYIYVAQSDFAAASNDAGTVEFAALPAGSYQVKIWHPRMADAEGIVQDLRIGAGATTEASASIELGRDRRIRRAPSSTRNRYR